MRNTSPRPGWRTVVVAAAIALIPSALFAQTGSISGTVTSGATPLSGMVVQIYGTSETLVNQQATNAAGGYTVANLAPGTYYAYAYTGNVTANYVDELYPNTQCAAGPLATGTYCRINTGAPIVVTAGANTGGIDFDLAVGGIVSGTVTAAGTAYANTSLELHIDTGATTSLRVRSALTNAAGAFQISRLPAGNYYVWAGNVTGGAASGYVSELYADVPCPKNISNIPMTGAGCSIANATAIPVASGAATNIGIDLPAGAAFSGTILGDGLPRESMSVGVPGAVGVVLLGAQVSSVTGGYLLKGLPAGTYQVTATGPGYTMAASSVSVSAGTIAPGPSFDLAPGFPSIVYSPETVPVNAGQTATIAVSAVGQAPLSYQWYIGNSGDTSNPVAGATSAEYTTPPVVGATNYWVRVTNSLGFASSQVATVYLANAGTGTVSGTLSSGGQPVRNGVVTIYSSAEVLVAASTRTSSTGAFAVAGLPAGTYYAVASSTAIAGNVTGSLVAPADFPFTDTLYPNLPCAGAHNTGGYCRISSGVPILVTANSVTSGVNFDMAAGGRITGTLTLSGQVPGPSAATQVSVLVDGPGAPRQVAFGHVDPVGTLVLPRLPAGSYRVAASAFGMASEVWDDTGCPAFNCLSAGGIPIVVPARSTVAGKNFDLAPAPAPPSISAQPLHQSISAGQSATLSVSAAGAGPFFYQWYRGPSGNTSTPIPGATGAVYNTGPLGRGAYDFWVSVANFGGTSASATATVGVNVGGYGRGLGGGSGSGGSGTIGPIPLGTPRRVPPPRR